MSLRCSALAAFAVLIATGCGVEIAQGPPSGRHTGEPFTTASGWAQRSTSVLTGEAILEVHLFEQEITPCTFDGTARDRYIEVSFPDSPGRHELSFDPNRTGLLVVFKRDAGLDDFAQSGFVEVERVTDTEVSFGVVAEGGIFESSDQHLNGRLSATICPG